MTTASIAHPDSTTPAAPMPPARIATYLFIAADIMFFMGLISSYLVLRSAQPELFAKFSQSLSKTSAFLDTFILTLSTITMRMSLTAAKSKNARKVIVCLATTFLLGCAFLAVASVEYIEKYHHHSVVGTDPSDERTYFYDGYESTPRTLHGLRKELLPGIPFDIHLVTATDAATSASEPQQTYTLRPENISQDLCYGPSKNIFYACYYTLTAAHAFHLVAAMLVILMMLLKTIGGRHLAAQIQNTALYWYFVTAIWLFLFPLLYFA